MRVSYDGGSWLGVELFPVKYGQTCMVRATDTGGRGLNVKQ